jgi:hypothetical protein
LIRRRFPDWSGVFSCADRNCQLASKPGSLTDGGSDAASFLHSGRTRIRPLLAFMEYLEGGGNVAIEKAIETMLQFH